MSESVSRNEIYEICTMYDYYDMFSKEWRRLLKEKIVPMGGRYEDRSLAT